MLVCGMEKWEDYAGRTAHACSVITALWVDSNEEIGQLHRTGEAALIYRPRIG